MGKALFLLFLATAPASAGFEKRGSAARTLALANACVAVVDDALSPGFNPAGLARIHTKQFAIGYSPRPFGIEELSNAGMALAWPTSIGVIGIGGSKFGFDLYKEVTGSLAFAATVSGVGLGIALDYYSVTIQRYGSAATGAADVGASMPLGSKLQVALSFMNISGATIGSSDERLPQSVQLGFQYTPASSLRLSADYRKELMFDASPSLGVEYEMLDAVVFRGGVSENPSIAAGGIGLRFLFVQFDYAMSHHETLGWTHAISLIMKWGGDDEQTN